MKGILSVNVLICRTDLLTSFISNPTEKKTVNFIQRCDHPFGTHNVLEVMVQDQVDGSFEISAFHFNLRGKSV